MCALTNQIEDVLFLANENPAMFQHAYYFPVPAAICELFFCFDFIFRLYF